MSFVGSAALRLDKKTIILEAAGEGVELHCLKKHNLWRGNGEVKEHVKSAQNGALNCYHRY